MVCKARGQYICPQCKRSLRTQPPTSAQIRDTRQRAFSMVPRHAQTQSERWILTRGRGSCTTTMSMLYPSAPLSCSEKYRWINLMCTKHCKAFERIDRPACGFVRARVGQRLAGKTSRSAHGAWLSLRDPCSAMAQELPRSRRVRTVSLRVQIRANNFNMPNFKTTRTG